MSLSPTAARRRTWGRAAAWTLGAVLILVVAAAAWIGVRGVLALGHLRDAQAAVAVLTDKLGNPAAASAAVGDVAEDTAAARSLTSDPVWRAAESLPWLGPQLAAVGTVAAAADEVAGTALTPLAETAASFSLDQFRPQGGAIDVEPFRTIAPAAKVGADGMARAATTLEAIDKTRLISPLRTQVDDLSTLLGQASTGADALARAAQLLPPMLGADGPRNYLIVFQNNAEWRSLGGIVGSMALIHTEGGRMTLVQQASGSEFARYPAPVVPLSEEFTSVYGARPALWMLNSTQVADFAVAGSIAKAMWQDKFGTYIDGVISIDPVALSYLLAATGPVQVSDGQTLTSENSVPLLLNGIYSTVTDPRQQDAFFDSAAAAVFNALSVGTADPTALIRGLTQAATERRLLLWSDHAEDQRVLEGTTLAGGLPLTDERVTAFGVYMNDGTGAKIDYFMTADAVADWCISPSGATRALVEIALRNDAPTDAASLPPYITGGGSFGVDPGNARTLVYVFLPPGAELLSVNEAEDDGTQGFGGGLIQEHQVVSWTTELAPGEQTRLIVEVSTPHTPEISVQRTPTVNTPETLQLAHSCEQAG